MGKDGDMSWLGKRIIHICGGKDEIICGRVGKDGVGWEAMGSFI